MNRWYRYDEIKNNLITQLAKMHVEEFESQLHSNNFDFAITKRALNQSSIETVLKESLQNYKFSY